jgi:ABC-type amino acid transport substrate-binding protein
MKAILSKVNACRAASIALGVFVCVGAAQAQTLKKIKDSGSITIAHREASVPFSYVDEQKRPLGYAIDICLKVVDAIKTELRMPRIEVKYLPISAAQRLPSIKEGKADLECGNTTNTPDRRKEVGFAIPYYIAGGRVMVKGPTPPRDFSELSGRRIVSNAKSTYERLITERNEKFSARITFVAAKDNEESFKLLNDGGADGWMTDDVILFVNRAQAAKPTDYSISAKLLTVEPLAIMFRKDDMQLAEVVNKEVRRIMQSGEIHGIYKKWFQSPIPPKNIKLDLPMNTLLKSFVDAPTSELPANF